MKNSSEKAVDLTKYLISLPNTKTTIIFILSFSILFGFIFGLFSRQIIDFESALMGIGNGLFVLAIPTFISAFIIFAIKRQLLLKRVLFLCFVTMILYSIAYAGMIFFDEPLNLIILLLDFGLVFAFWYLIFNTVFGLKKLAILFAGIQLTLNSLFLLVGSYIYVSNNPIEILIKIYFASAVFFGGIYIFLIFINAPMKRVFGIKSTDAFNLFLAQWLYKSKGLEDTFGAIGETVETQIGVARFKGKKQDILFIVPYIHFGPFGNLGGSEFSYLIAEQFEKYDCFVFHGTATHDFNPVSSNELTKVIESIKIGINEMKLTPVKAQIKKGQYKTCTAHCIEFNNSAFIGLTRAPETTEDIEYSIGTSLMNKAEQFVKTGIIFDEHNSETGQVVYVVSGSPYYNEFSNAIVKCLSKKESGKKLKIGTSQKLVNINNIGKAGVKLTVFEADKKMIWIVLDSNGITPRAREYYINEIKKTEYKNYLIEIMTTDTHEINAVKGVLNPITLDEVEELIPLTKEMIYEAKNKLEEVEGGMIKVPLIIDVFGTTHTSELISTVNAIVAVGKIALPLILIATILMVLWGLTLL